MNDQRQTECTVVIGYLGLEIFELNVRVVFSGINICFDKVQNIM